MLILLPPSETKRPGGSDRFMDTELPHASALGGARRRVRDALVELSQDPEAAAKPLKLGSKNRSELEHNLRLDESGVLPAIERYTGVLYDALGVDSLDDEARGWVDARVRVQSALFGLVGAGDRIPAYRLSAGSRLPGLDRPLKRIWSDAHAAIDWSGAGLVLDLRSQDYSALAPLPEGVGHFVHVMQRGVDGEVRALNHFNKAAKGDLVRHLARSGVNFDTLDELRGWAEIEGIELGGPAEDGSVTLITALGVPAASGPSSRQG